MNRFISIAYELCDMELPLEKVVAPTCDHSWNYSRLTNMFFCDCCDVKVSSQKVYRAHGNTPIKTILNRLAGELDDIRT